MNSEKSAINQYITVLLEQTKPNPAYIHSIILKAISDDCVHAGFSEISALPLVQQTLQEYSTGKSILRTLDLFSYESFLDYTSALLTATNNDDCDETRTYVKLNDAQVMKLKLLTVVSIVQQTLDSMNLGGDKISVNNSKVEGEVPVPSSSRIRRNRRAQIGTAPTEGNKHAVSLSNHKHCGIMQYSVLQNALGMNDIRELEDILIKCIYSNLLPTGTKLDQKNMCLVDKHSLHVSSSTGSDHVLCRDVNVTTDISDLIYKLEMVHNRGENVKNYLIKSLSGLNKGIVEDLEKWKRVEESIKLAQVENCMKHSKENSDDAVMAEMEGGNGLGRLLGLGKKHLKRNHGGHQLKKVLQCK